MLGNWSLGDYFKREQLPQVWEFLTERVGLDPNRIYVSCFSGDEANGIAKDTESAEIWTELFSAAGRQRRPDRPRSPRSTAPRSATRARGSRSTARRTGGAAAARPRTCRSASPAGPDSEMFYLFPQVEHDPAFGAQCHQNCDCGRYMEIGNSVFMEFVRTETGFAPLPRTQRRLRRRARPHRGGVHGQPGRVPDQPAVADRRAPAEGDRRRATRSTRRRCGWSPTTCAARRSSPSTGSCRSNKTQGYVMRRLVRRAIRFAFELGLDQDFFPDMVPGRRRHVHRGLPRGRGEPRPRRRSARQGGEGVPPHPAQGPQAAHRPSPRPARSAAPSCSRCTTPSASPSNSRRRRPGPRESR